jgi:hypothetical protein
VDPFGVHVGQLSPIDWAMACQITMGRSGPVCSGSRGPRRRTTSSRSGAGSAQRAVQATAAASVSVARQIAGAPVFACASVQRSMLASTHVHRPPARATGRHGHDLVAARDQRIDDAHRRADVGEVRLDGSSRLEHSQCPHRVLCQGSARALRAPCLVARRPVGTVGRPCDDATCPRLETDRRPAGCVSDGRPTRAVLEWFLRWRVPLQCSPPR